MTIKVAINGFGRIGRMVLRSHYESGKKHGLQFVAINDLGDAATNAHLLKYDTAHGKFPGSVRVEGDNLVVNNDRIRVVAERDPAKLPWKQLGVDVVMECTGVPSVIIDAITRNASDGVVCLTGVSSMGTPMPVDVGSTNLENLQVSVGPAAEIAGQIASHGFQRRLGNAHPVIFRPGLG